MLPLMSLLLQANVVDAADAKPTEIADSVKNISAEAQAASVSLPGIDNLTKLGDSIGNSGTDVSGQETFQILKTLLSEDTISHIISGLISFGFKLALALTIFFIGKFIIRWIFRWVRKVMSHKGADPSLVTFLVSLIKITLYFILLITVIGIIGVPTSSFLAIFASAGVAVGLALSGTLQNFAGGVLILLLRPYKVGDFIEAQGFTGTVKEIQIFNTIINTPDNKTIVIPNGGLSTGSINNYSMESRRRVDWTVGVAYGTEFSIVKELILKLLHEDKRIHKDVEPTVYINELADSSVNLAVRAWVNTKDYWDVYFDINEKIYAVLPEHGIEFPFPQIDVHMQH